MKFPIIAFFTFIQTIAVLAQNDGPLGHVLELANAGNYKTAIKKLDQLILKDSTNFNLFALRGRFFLEDGNFQMCYNDLSKSIELKPKHPLVYFYRAELYNEANNFDDAIKDCNTGLSFINEKDTLFDDLLFLRALNFESKNDLNSARSDYENLLKEDPRHIGSLSNIANVLDELGKHEEAILYLNHLLEIGTRRAKYLAHVNLSYCYSEIEKYDKAIASADSALLYAPEDESIKGAIFNNRALAELKVGMLQQAALDLNTSFRFYQNNPYAYRNRALLNIALKRTDEACADIKTSIELGCSKKLPIDLDEFQKQHCN
jgi:tetratricopeptide (TPR) repeat protein